MKCVLFDLDGTVADTEVLKAKALALAVHNFGGKVSPDLYKSVMGKSWEDVTGAFFQHAGIEVDLETFNPIFREFYSQLIDSELVENRSIKHFLNFLKMKKVSIGLVSSASPWMIQRALAKLDIETYFDVVISNADTQKHKPHPEGYLKALTLLKMLPLETIAFEDSESGFMAAATAGLSVYGVRHSYNEMHSFKLCAGTVSSFDECIAWEMFRE